MVYESQATVKESCPGTEEAEGLLGAVSVQKNKKKIRARKDTPRNNKKKRTCRSPLHWSRIAALDVSSDDAGDAKVVPGAGLQVARLEGQRGASHGAGAGQAAGLRAVLDAEPLHADDIRQGRNGTPVKAEASRGS